jgi:hypothetical protein
MHIESPTRREIWLAVLLLLSLLLISRSRSDFGVSPSLRTRPNVNTQSKNSSYVEHEVAPQPLRDRIRWGTGEIPHTEVVAHVPGELYIVGSWVFLPLMSLRV